MLGVPAALAGSPPTQNDEVCQPAPSHLHMSPRFHSRCWEDQQSSFCPAMSQEGMRLPRAASEPGTSGQGHGLRGLSSRCCVYMRSGLKPRGLCTRVRETFESGKLQWDLGSSEGRCLDLRPHGQTPAATVVAAVLEGIPTQAAGSRVVARTQAAAPTWPTSGPAPWLLPSLGRVLCCGFPPRSRAKG